MSVCWLGGDGAAAGRVYRYLVDASNGWRYSVTSRRLWMRTGMLMQDCWSCLFILPALTPLFYFGLNDLPLQRGGCARQVLQVR